MLEDRSYMRSDSFRPRWSMTIILLIANVAVFALQEIVYAYRLFPLDHYFALSNDGLKSGFLWQLVTFQFLHGGGWHLIFNLLGIFIFGRVVEERLGQVGFLKVYFLSGIMGGIFQSLLALMFPSHFGAVVGASAGVCGLIAAYTLLEPDGVIMLWFILPVRARYFLYGLVAISIFYLFLATDSHVAHAAHLGGIFAGWLYLRWDTLFGTYFTIRRSGGPRHRPRELIKIHLPKAAPWQRGKIPEAENLPPEEFISKEVDPILDKISAHGIQSLTPKERQILEAARAKMDER